MNKEILLRRIQDFANDIENIPLADKIQILNEAPEDLESKCWVPSWRRMCKVILRNDYWCKGLGQTQPFSDAYGKFKDIKAKRKREAVL